MADEKPSGGHYDILWYVGGILLVLVVLWFHNGGPNKTDLRGLFLAPPAPLGTGDAYGPQVGRPATSTQN